MSIAHYPSCTATEEKFPNPHSAKVVIATERGDSFPSLKVKRGKVYTFRY